MRTLRTGLIGIIIFSAAIAVQAQNDGDHGITNPGGTTFLATDTQVPVAPVNVVVGTAPNTNATLNVRGDQLPILDPTPPQAGSLCTFRTDVASATAQSWWMKRDVLDLGVIWNESLQRAFHVQSFETRDDGQDRYSGLMLHNETKPEWNGLWIMNEGPPTGTRAFPNPTLQLLDAKGFAGLGYIETMRSPGVTNPRGPWSRFHLFHNVMGTRPQFAFRTQMRNGMTLTGNSDHAYIGQWYDQGTSGTGAEVDDNSNVVISTSENALPAGLTHRYDNTSFRFFGDLATTTDGPASTVRGLEMMRIQPVRLLANDPVQAFVGIGDFLTVGAGPEERLDVLDRTMRLRGLPTTTYQLTGGDWDRVMVVTTDGTVKWRSATTIGSGAAGCDWLVDGTGLDVTTAWDPGAPAGCPALNWKVGVGTNAPTAKLGVDVNQNNTTATLSEGVRSRSYNGTSRNTALWGQAEIAIGAGGAAAEMMGVYGEAFLLGTAYSVFGGRFKAVTYTNTPTTYEVFGSHARASLNSEFTWAYGAFGQVNNSTNFGRTFGVAGRAYGGWDVINGSRIGVYGEAAAGTNSYAGYFNGNVAALGTFTAGVVLPWSDGLLKQNETTITSASAVLGQIVPITFNFDTAQFQGLNLPTGTHAGVEAQNVQNVLPHLVHTVSIPAQYDTAGTMTSAPLQFMAVNYDGLIPYTIAGHQEQQAGIEDLQQSVAQLQQQNAAMLQQLSACCLLNDGSLMQAQDPDAIGYIDNTQRAAEVARQLAANELLVIPNPFRHNPTINYRLGTDGRAQLRVSDAQGRAMGVLLDAGTVAGQHSMVWNTEGMAAGTYWLTLTVDGQRITEQAVKVQ